MISATIAESASTLGAQPMRVHSNASNPSEWTVGDWSTVLGTCSAVAGWFWRHTLLGFCKWVWNGIKAPSRIEAIYLELKTELKATKYTAEYALATSRIAWSYVERPVMQFDAMGHCIACNDFILRLTVRQLDEFLMSSWKTLVHSEDLERVERQWEAAVREHRNFVQSFRLITSSGDSIRVFDRAETLHDSAGNVIGWSHLLSVVTD